jgi:uncharacterized protein YrrD
MFLLAKQLINLPVISLQTGRQVATAGEPIINPDNLSCVAFHCTTTQRLAKPIIMARDIRQVARDAMIVDSEEEVSEAEEIVRLAETLKFRIVGCNVATESGEKLGKVEDYTLNVDDWRVNKIYVKPPFLKSLLSSNLIIDHNQITEARIGHITVRDAWVKQPFIAPAPKPVK